MFGKSITTGKLLVAASAAAIDPSFVSGGALTVETANALYDNLKAKSPKLDKLANELTDTFQKDLASEAFAKPEDARLLLPKMLEHAAAHLQFLEQRFDPEQIYAAVEHQLKAQLDGSIYMPAHFSKFKDLLLPLLDKACNDPRMKQALAMPIKRKELGDLQEILNRIGGIEEAMSNPAALSLGDLQTIVRQFEGPESDDLEFLANYLSEKAPEYRSYRAQIDSLDERVAAVANLKGAAQDAAERLDFDEVEELLARVNEVEAEIFAETSLSRAQNALLRNRPDDAHRLLTAAAEAFGVVDALEPAKRRNTYAKLLYEHGLRYGGTGFARAADMWQRASEAAEGKDSALWAMAQNNLAIALGDQALRTSGEEGAALLARALEAFEAALIVYTKDAHPVDWAMTQNNLATALWEQARRTSGEEGAALLARAVEAFEAALTVRTKDAHPVDWAMTQNNLATALANQAQRTSGEGGAALLARAVKAYEAALTVFTEGAHPVDWAMTQNNLAIALRDQARRTSGEDGAALLARAVEACEAALTVRTKDAHPVAWAMTQNNLAIALLAQAQRTSGAEGAALLGRAEKAYEAALTVRTKEEQPQHFAETQENLAILHLTWAGHDSCDAPRAHLDAALAHVDTALELYDPVHTSYRHEQATRLREHLRAALEA